MGQPKLPYSDLTLEKALLTFRHEHGLEGKYQDLSADAQAHYERHDIIHVLFGLDTSMRQEAQADGWTLLASDISWNDIRTFMRLPEEKELITELGWWSITKTFVRALPDYLGMAWRARRMRKKWRWSDNAQYRNARVADIREEFGITRTLAV